MIGSSMPASVTMPKYRMAKMNIPATGATSLMPPMMNLLVLSPNPPTSAAMTGMAMSATSGDMRLVRMTTNSATMVSSPSIASMVSSEFFGFGTPVGGI